MSRTDHINILWLFSNDWHRYGYNNNNSATATKFTIKFVKIFKLFSLTTGQLTEILYGVIFYTFLMSSAEHSCCIFCLLFIISRKFYTYLICRLFLLIYLFRLKPETLIELQSNGNDWQQFATIFSSLICLIAFKWNCFLELKFFFTRSFIYLFYKFWAH